MNIETKIKGGNKMSKRIESAIAFIWFSIMVLPILGQSFDHLPITQVQAIRATFYSVFILGWVGYGMYCLYLFSKNYSDYKWKKSDF